MPRFIYIDGYHVVNTGTAPINITTDFLSPEPRLTADMYQPFPYIITERIFIRNAHADNGQPFTISSNEYKRSLITPVYSWDDNDLRWLTHWNWEDNALPWPRPGD
jgi:hypothetical protein